MITDIVNHLKDMLELPDEEIPEFIDTFLSLWMIAVNS